MTTVKQYSYLYEFCARDKQSQMCGTQHFKEITTKTNSLPSTINAADWLTFPSKFVPVHVYSPASARVTRCTTSLPSGLRRARFLQPELSESNHVIVGDGFPVAEHWNSAFWFSLTVNTLGEIATVGIEIDSPGSPFAPGKPLEPGFPVLLSDRVDRWVLASRVVRDALCHHVHRFFPWLRADLFCHVIP